MLLIHGDMKDKYVDVQLVYVDMQLKCTMLLYIHNIDMWDKYAHVHLADIIKLYVDIFLLHHN